MPRLNLTDYLARHQRLRNDWLEGAPLIRQLRNEQQWALHDYYFPTFELTNDALRRRRAAAARQDPGLSKRAGLSYRTFAILLARTMPVDAESSEHPVAPRHTGGNVVVETAMTQPQPERATPLIIDEDAMASWVQLLGKYSGPEYRRRAQENRQLLKDAQEQRSDAARPITGLRPSNREVHNSSGRALSHSHKRNDRRTL